MREIAGTPPVVDVRAGASSRSSGCARRCGAHYAKKRAHYGVDHPNFYDRDLRRLFSDAPEFRAEPEGVALHPRASAATCGGSSPSGPASYQYTIDQVIEDMITPLRTSCTCA